MSCPTRPSVVFRFPASRSCTLIHCIAAFWMVAVVEDSMFAQSNNIEWSSKKLSPLFIAEGGTIADVDADGHPDVIAGPWVYFGPDHATKIELYAAKTYNIAGYSEHFFMFDYDIDRDGDVDLLLQGFPGAAAYWFRNPGVGKCRTEPWERFTVLDVVDNESPTFGDVTGDGVPELICNHAGQFGYVEIPSDPTKPWSFHAVSEPGNYQRFTHGIGIGDVNDDGRSDVMAKNGWWEHPATLSDMPWVFHPFEFSGPGGAQMYAVDFDGDKRNEIVTSLAAHGYGLVVYQKTDNTADHWTRIDIMTDKAETSPTGLAISQLHAIDMADIDGDGKLDIVTGKRFWAHNGNDAGENETPFLVWFKAVKAAGGIKFEPNLIDDNSGVGTQVVARDANGDGKVDVLSVSKRGIHVLTQVPAGTNKPVRAANAIATESIEIKDEIGGYRPAWSATEPMNFDFETGDLRDWKAFGGAFFNQPILGDAVNARRKDMTSNHQGKYWVGTYEVAGDIGMGSLTSSPFRLQHPWISFLLAGGSGPETRLEIIDAETGAVLKKVHGYDGEALKRAVLSVDTLVGKTIAVRLIDNNRDGWGHINFDDLRTHATAPKIPDNQRLPTVDVVLHNAISPDAAAAAMTLPEGFSVQVIASEPDVRQPIAMTIDHRGRVWVVEGFTYPLRAEGDVGKDRVLILEDTDQNGTLDSRKVFTEGLNLVSGIEVGFGGVWIGAAPYLLFIPDRDGDDKPDGPPIRKLDGWGYQDTHETLNSFIWGPDGWLYGCHGVFTYSDVGVVESEKSVKQKDAPKSARTKINAGIWRYHPVEERFEVFAHGTSNPWGVDFDDRGQAFLTACVIPHLYHVIPNARYQRQAGEHFNPYTYSDIQTIARHRHWVGDNPHAGNNRSDSAGGGHAHSGAMIYLGGSWPNKYRDQIFMNNIHGARINEDLLIREGSGYAGDRAPDFLLTNDRSSQILYFRYGPDGQAIAIDWYDAQQCHLVDPSKHDQSNGRIYRIAYNNAAPVQVDLAKKTDLELVQLQSDKNDWYVRTARRLLMERSATRKLAADSLADLANLIKSPEARIRLRGLWVLAACKLITESQILTASSDPDEFVRAWSIQLVAQQSIGSDNGKLFQRWLDLAANDPSPVVRLYLASACQTIPIKDASKIVLSLIAHREDQGDHNLPLMYWYATSRVLSENNALGQSLLDASRVDLVSKYIARQWTQSAIATSGDKAPESLTGLLEWIAKTDRTDLAVSLIDEVLVSLGSKRSIAAPSTWPSISKRLLSSSNESIQTQAVLLAAKFQDEEALNTLRVKATNPNEKIDRRASALRVLRQIKAEGLGDLAIGLIDDPAMRAIALATVADSLTGSQTTKILETATKWTEIQDRRLAWYALLRRPESAKALLTAVQGKSIAASDLSADMIQQMKRLDAPELLDIVRNVWGNVRSSSEDKIKAAEGLKKIVEAESPKVDIERGKLVYTKTCGQCHVLFNEGGKIGPELTGSNRRDLNYLLENILDPSAVMAKEYQPWVIQTDDGQTITGLLRSSDNDSIKIQTATEEVTIYKSDIAQQKQSELSMMPADLLTPLSVEETRNLFAYLRSR